MSDVVKSLSGMMKSVGSRQIRVIVSTSDVDREGDIIEPKGIDLSAYRANPVILFQHDHDEPIARCINIDVVSDRVEALIQFPEEGANSKSDEIYALIKAGVLNAISIGFIPKAWEPIKGSLGRRFTSSEMLEASVVSVPANANALIIERSIKSNGGIMPAKLKNLAELSGESKVKGMWLLSQFAQLLNDLDWLEDDAEWENECEGDDSPVPQMISDALTQLAEAFLAMAQEEVDEMLGEEAGEKSLAALAKLRKALTAPVDANGTGTQPVIPSDPEADTVGKDGEPEMCPHCGQPMTEGCAPEGKSVDGGTVFKAVEKAGRVLSNSNYDKLKTAATHLGDVLAAHESSLVPEVPADANGGDPIPAVPTEASIVITNSFSRRKAQIELIKLKGSSARQ